MQKIIKLCFGLICVVTVFSCKREISMVTYNGGTAPVLKADKANIPLSFATKDQEAVTISWTNPTYQFSTGTSSQNVSYLIEIDTAGANFSNPARKKITVSGDLSMAITQDQLNGYLLNDMGLVQDIPHNIEIRVTSSMVNNSAMLTSNVLKYTVTPYSTPPAVDPPASGKLFITGSATPSSWMSGGDPEVPSQEFTKVSPTLFQLDHITLTGGNSYLFVPVYGDWGAKYGGTGSNNTNNVNGDSFKANGGDLLAPATTGDYKIVVDFQRGKFTVTHN